MPESSLARRMGTASLRRAAIVFCIALSACHPREQASLVDFFATLAQGWHTPVAFSALPGLTCDTIYLAAPQPACSLPTRASRHDALRTLAAMEATLAAQYAVRPSAEVAHQLGLVQLVAAADSVGVDRAIELFTQAALAEPSSAMYGNDLAAALLLRYSEQRRMSDLFQASELSSTFVNRAHPDRQSCWNAIVSLAWLSMREQVKRTRTFCESTCASEQCDLPVISDDSPPFGADARTVALDGRWTDAAWDYATVHLLPAWARSVRDGDIIRASALHGDLLRVHHSLEQRIADSSIGQALSAISQSPVGSERRRESLLALELYAASRQLTNVHQVATGDALLDSVFALTRPSDHVRLWASMYKANRLLTSGRASQALRAYRTLGAARHAPATVLGGRLAFNEGLAIMALGDQVGGLQRIEAQAEQCTALARDECALAAWAMAASIATLVGDDDRSEQNTQRALERSVTPLTVSRWSLLSVLRQTAELYGFAITANLLHDEAIQVAQQLSRPDLEAQDLVLRAQVRSRQSDSIGMRRLINSFDTLFRERLSERDQRFYRAEQLWVEGEYRLLTGRSGARAMLDSSIAQMASDTNSARQLRPRLSRARALAIDGDTLSALHALDSLLRALESRNGLHATLFERVRVSENALAVGEVAAELLRRRNDTAALFRALSAKPFIAVEMPTRDGDSTRLDLATRRLFDTVFVWHRLGGDWRMYAVSLPERVVHSASATLELSQLSALYASLLAPALARAGALVRSMRVDAQGDLADVPWSALYDTNTRQFLVERLTLWHTDDLWRRIEKPRALRRARVLVIDAAPRSGRRALPGAKNEVQQLQTVWGEQSERFDAAEGAVPTLGRMPAYDLVHFAGHAVLHSARPERSYLELPSLADARITGVQVASSSLRRTQLVVLAACNTRAGAARVGAATNSARFGNGMLSLAGAFREAGAKHVIGAAWAIDDAATAAIMEQLHIALRAGSSPARALQQAQLAGLRSPDPARRSPRVWAAFQLLGS